MILGIVSDIHGNADGLRTALDALRGADRLICLGDAISDYRFSNEVVHLLREHAVDTIHGNHEQMFYSEHGVRARAAAWIAPDHLAWLAARPDELRIEHAGKSVLAVHSTPWSPRGGYVYGHTAEMERFGDAAADIVLYGHTHKQLIKRVGRVLVVNPGSAGQARDAANGHRLSCALLDVEREQVTIIDY